MRKNQFKVWNEKEIDLLEVYYPIHSTKFIIKNFIPNKTESQIRSKVADLGIKAQKRRDWQKKPRVCVKCGKTFYFITHKTKRKRCPDCFKIIERRAEKEYVCKNCGKGIIGREGYKRTFCNMECSKNYYIDHPGKSIRNKQRRRFLREVMACMICGYDKHEQILQIHHLNGKNNRPENLIKICPNCHRAIHCGLLEYKPLD